jgi:predicted MPP superfamily phosphohydrolase
LHLNCGKENASVLTSFNSIIVSLVSNVRTGKMQLVQLSDIHVGSFFKQQVFDTVVDEVNKLNPDAVIITGDLTDEGLLF